MDDGGFRVIEHTADVGISAFGETPLGALLAACKGMFRLMAEGGELPVERRVLVEASGADWEGLLFNLLNELIYISDARGLVPREVHLDSFREDREGYHIRVTVSGASKGSARRHLVREVKAATYHGLSFKREGSTYSVQVIFDV